MALAVKQSAAEFKNEVKKQVTNLITAAFGFVAALSWNDAIKAMMTAFIGTAEAWPYMVLNAVVVTVIAVIAIVLISKYMK
jgi:membrane protein YdbS with pleckstrin-like domain